MLKKLKKLLSPSGIWLSVVGSAEADHWQIRPPKRSLLDTIPAIEPFLKIKSIKETYIQTNIHNLEANISTDNGKIKAFAIVSSLRNLD